MNIWAVILAAGQGRRLAKSLAGNKKQYIPHKGAPLYWRSAKTLASNPKIKGLVFVFPRADLDRAKKRLAGLMAGDDLGVPFETAPGGELRQDSVKNGLDALPAQCTHVMVHDAARPFVSPALVERLGRALETGAKAVIPALPVKDTIKRVKDDKIVQTLERAELYGAQTPQAFDRAVLNRAHEQAAQTGTKGTDDASMVEALGVDVTVVPGDEENVKITTAEDLKLLEEVKKARVLVPCVGFGYDVHRFGTGRPLKLGGFPVPKAPQVVAHSDGDVLFHALTDALLGCAGLGDIGRMFPDNDPANEGLESSIFVNEALIALQKKGFEVVHADLTVIAQVPRIAPHVGQIRKGVAEALKLDKSRVNIKATTEEGLGFTGEEKGIKAVAVVTAVRAVEDPD